MLRGINSATGFMRREMKGRLSLKYIPELKFILDESMEEAEYIFELMDRLSTEGSCWCRPLRVRLQTPGHNGLFEWPSSPGSLPSIGAGNFPKRVQNRSRSPRRRTLCPLNSYCGGDTSIMTYSTERIDRSKTSINGFLNLYKSSGPYLYGNGAPDKKAHRPEKEGRTWGYT